MIDFALCLAIIVVWTCTIMSCAFSNNISHIVASRYCVQTECIQCTPSADVLLSAAAEDRPLDMCCTAAVTAGCWAFAPQSASCSQAGGRRQQRSQYKGLAMQTFWSGAAGTSTTICISHTCMLGLYMPAELCGGSGLYDCWW